MMPPLLKRGLQGIFYIGVALAILGVIGKIRNPTWQPLADSKNPSAADLEQKINDMELQNNLMRAEIDLLNKQVKYLNNLNEPQQQRKQGKYKEGKTFKVWSGNGDTLRPVEITKDDLKRPYKCPDGTFTEFAGMCVENQRHEPNIVEQFEQVVDDLKQHSETIQTFEKVAQELHGFTESPLEQVQQFLKESGSQQTGQDQASASTRNQEQRPTKEFIKNKPIYEQQYGGAAEYQQTPPTLPPYEHKDYEKCKDKSDTKCFDKEFKRPEGEKYGYKKHYDSHLNEKFDKFKYPKAEKNHKFDSRQHEEDKDDSRERFNKRRYDSKERHQKRKDDSKEHHRKRNNDDDSKERYQKRDDDSKERFNKRSRESSSKERVQKQNSQDSGEWQEQYMKHRENLRKEHEQKYYGDNKNWYIKRGDGRENKRNTDEIRYS